MSMLNLSDRNACQRLLISRLTRTRLNLGHGTPGISVRPEEVELLPSEADCGLATLGLQSVSQIYHNLPVAELVEHAVIRAEATLAANGALCVQTGKYTGRSPKDRFIVEDLDTRDTVDWNEINRPISEDHFQALYDRAIAYLQEREAYIFDGYVGADPTYRLGVRVINELAWQNLFAHQLFQRPTPSELQHHQADITVIAVPGLQSDPTAEGTRSEAFVILHLARRIILIGGTYYAGEIKKSVFSLLNYVMPQRQVLPMHGAANIAADGHTALFFGLSGTGKTTLSADPDRRLIGDDEHGWSPKGVFNFEGGCYAKTIRLSQMSEPQIWAALRFGAVLENVVLAPDTQQPDYASDRLTENTRAAYPIDHITNVELSGQGNHPQVIFFLTADAFGVLPPIARLTREQAMYHFLSGYTSKLAGTERGITTPQATFSACFGQAFLPLRPTVYAAMLGDRLRQHPNTEVYLVNTGWLGGGYGVGQRISIQHTRAIVTAALRGDLAQTDYIPHPIFKVLVPAHVPGIPDELLNPQMTWVDPLAYDQQVRALAQQFIDNFHQFSEVPPEIAAAAPNPQG